MMSNSTRRSATSIGQHRRLSNSEGNGENSAMLVKTCKTQLPQAQRVSHVVVQMSAAENGNINHSAHAHGSGQMGHEGSNGGCLHRSISNSSSQTRPIPKENFQNSSSSTSTSNKATMVSTKRTRKHSKRNTAVTTTLPIESDDSNTSMENRVLFAFEVLNGKFLFGLTLGTNIGGMKNQPRH